MNRFPSDELSSSDLFSFEVEHRSSGVAFRLRGELDLYPLPRLQEAFDAVLEQGVGHVVMDFSGITFLGSSGMNFLVQADRRLRNQGGKLRVENIPAVVYRLLEIAGLHQVLEVTRAEGSDSADPEPV